MKYIKKFETFGNLLEIGTYVICYEEETNEDFKKFLLSNIGQIVSYNHSGYLSGKDFPYIVKYENIPDIPTVYNRLDEVDNPDNPGFTYSDRRFMSESDIIHHSKNKEDLAPFIDSIKYNI